MKSLERREASRNYYHLAILTLMARGCLASAGKCWNPAILCPTQVWPLLIFSQFWNCSGNSKQPPIACLRTILRHKQSERACFLPVALFNAQHPWFLKKNPTYSTLSKNMFVQWKSRYSIHVPWISRPEGVWWAFCSNYRRYFGLFESQGTEAGNQRLPSAFFHFSSLGLVAPSIEADF